MQMADLSTFWDARVDREESRERDNPRKRIHTDLLWRLVDRSVPSSGGTVLDAGAGTGRFSLPLASRGFRVTHFDISPKMIERASATADRDGLMLTFTQGDIVDLSRFPDGAFDLVLCLDSPLSFCYPHQAKALAELVRVCRKSMVLCVTSRLGAIMEGGIAFDLRHFGKPNTVWNVFRTGDLIVTAELQKLQSIMPSFHAFSVEELEGMLTEHGLKIESIMAPGALAGSVPPDILATLIDKVDAYREFLDFEEQFDTQRTVLGTSVSGAGGLAVTATKIGTYT
jgi:ubiquinone/menaquinone biosynthesis C-methylase UbiE